MLTQKTLSCETRQVAVPYSERQNSKGSQLMTYTSEPQSSHLQNKDSNTFFQLFLPNPTWWRGERWASPHTQYQAILRHQQSTQGFASILTLSTQGQPQIPHGLRMTAPPSLQMPVVGSRFTCASDLPATDWRFQQPRPQDCQGGSQNTGKELLKCPVY